MLYINYVNKDINTNLCVLVYRDAIDRFEFSCKILGDIVSICLGHIPKDGKKSKSEAFWGVEEVIVTEKNLGNRLVIPVQGPW